MSDNQLLAELAASVHSLSGVVSEIQDDNMKLYQKVEDLEAANKVLLARINQTDATLQSIALKLTRAQ